MHPDLAYEWLAPKLTAGERQALDSIYSATKVGSEEVFHPVGTPVDARPLLALVPQQRQRQDDTNAQLRAVMAMANRMGCYDAADVIGGILERAKA